MTVIMPNKNKMKTKVLASIVIFGMAVMVLSSCSKLPQGEIDAVEISINETSTLFESGEYIATLDKANAAREKAMSINEELTGVIAKYKSNVQSRRS